MLNIAIFKIKTMTALNIYKGPTMRKKPVPEIRRWLLSMYNLGQVNYLSLLSEPFSPLVTKKKKRICLPFLIHRALQGGKVVNMLNHFKRVELNSQWEPCHTHISMTRILVR